MSLPGTVYLVSCVKSKAKQACAAKDLYSPSALFRKARAYVESLDAAWFILSAKHGLVAPDTVIAPYELTLKKMKRAERCKWAELVAGQFAAQVKGVSRIVFLAGLPYREFLIPHFEKQGLTTEVPMARLGNGKQLVWLVEHTSSKA